MLPDIKIFSIDEFGTRTLRMVASRLVTALHLAKSFAVADQSLYLVTVETTTKSGSLFMFSNGTLKAFGNFTAESFADWQRWQVTDERIKARQSKHYVAQNAPTLVRRASNPVFAI